ncbi:hypothetical protein [Nonomuraea sp. NPDC005650]|uniref:hypothetical protein n=1 Tax=Nonomuraea sp. NPDC005650 TaxID=3157045 RepID=UPI0033AE5A8C
MWARRRTEVAVLLAAQALGADLDAARQRGRAPPAVPFQSRAQADVDHDQRDDRLVAHTKGAPETLLPRCTTFLDCRGRMTPVEARDQDLITDQVSATGSIWTSSRKIDSARLPQGSPAVAELNELCAGRA